MFLSQTKIPRNLVFWKYHLLSRVERKINEKLSVKVKKSSILLHSTRSWHWDIPFFIRTPRKDGGFLQRGGSDFVFKEADKIRTLQKFFSKVPTNNQPFRFHFSKGPDKKLRVRIPAILSGGGGGGGGGGGADKKWNVPFVCHVRNILYFLNLHICFQNPRNWFETCGNSESYRLATKKLTC